MSPFVIVTGDFTPWGGMDRANYELARHLAGHGDTVHLVAHRVDPELAAHRNVVVHRVARPGGSHLLGAPLLDRAGRRCSRETSPNGHTVVNGGNCHWTDINWVHYVHAAWQSQTNSIGPVRRWKNAISHRCFAAAERSVVPQARLVIANSERTRDDLVRHLGAHEDRIQVVYYGTDPQTLRPANSDERSSTREEFEWPTDRPLVAFVGALGDERKGFDTAYAAWRSLCRRRAWDADLIVMGTGRSLVDWQRRVAADGLSARVRLLGFRHDVPRLLRACDALIAPTRYEAYGLGVHEALCCGLPAIVSRRAGVAERYPDDLAELLLDDSDDAEELVLRLLNWRRSLGDWTTRLTPLRRTLSAWTWDDMANRIVELTCGSKASRCRAEPVRQTSDATGLVPVV